MKNKLLLVLLMSLLGLALNGQSINGWEIMDNASFKSVYVDEFEAETDLLLLTDDLKKRSGEHLTISGYYVPLMDDDVMILSKFSFANCFFCGGAGLESVVQIELKDDIPYNLEMDQKIKVSGRIYFNDSDWDKLSFILKDATLMEL